MIIDSLEEFTGASRRFEYRGTLNGAKVYDDYAHHPTEILATIKSAQSVPHNKLWIVFQPHTYTRTIYLNSEFKDVFNDKKTYIMNTFTSREEYNNITESIVKEVFKEQEKYDIEKIKSILEKNNQVIIFMGAGNINQEIRKIVSCNL